jgi:hypothetical protein
MEIAKEAEKGLRINSEPSQDRKLTAIRFVNKY